MTDEELIAFAWENRKKAYIPYSHFAVGAALLCKDGSVFGGCNIENASYGLTNCAERTAVFSAIAQGHRDFAKLVVCAETKQPVMPCGSCRQVLLEFAPDMPVIMLGSGGVRMDKTVRELLPGAFEAECMTDARQEEET